MAKNLVLENPTLFEIATGITLSQTEILQDFEWCCISREASLLGRKEVLTGKAKFGIFGDGKEVPQVAMAKAFKNGDFRAGYYRDQTFAFVTGISTVEAFFAQLYADADNDPHDMQISSNNKKTGTTIRLASPLQQGKWAGRWA